MPIPHQETDVEAKTKVEAEIDALTQDGEFSLDDIIAEEPQPSNDETAIKKAEESEVEITKADENEDGEEKPSKRWQKRVDTLTHQAREAERIATAQRIENEQLQKRLAAIETKQHENSVEDFKQEYSKARVALEAAIEQGDTQKQVELSEKIADMRAQARIADMRKQAQEVSSSEPSVNNNPQITNEAKSWAQRNNWFFDPQQEQKRRYAQFIDQELSSEGYNPNTREYFDELDKRIKEQFTTQVDSDNMDTSSQSKPKVGAAAPKTQRRSSSKRTLTPAQAKIAKELGLTTPEAINAYLQELNKVKG